MSSVTRPPRSYVACRDRFRALVTESGWSLHTETLTCRGPAGERLAIDHAICGDERAERALVVLSGVHGVEAFVNSALQCDLLHRLAGTGVPTDVVVHLVHVVNPWGMSHGRRQNESNVDLNRNWARSRREPVHNDPYDALHPIVCPDSDEPPRLDDLLSAVEPFVREHGTEWVRNAITRGQYRHADGLHFGGDHTEESLLSLERAMIPRLHRTSRLFVLDLHAGHGPYGRLVTLCDRPVGSPQHELLSELFADVEATAEPIDGQVRVKAGPIARGIATDTPRAEATVATLEVGTIGDVAQLEITAQEMWAHRRGGLSSSEHAALRERYRNCFSPDDPEWERAALDAGGDHLDAALQALADGR